MLPYLCLLVLAMHKQMISMLLKCFLHFKSMQYMCVWYIYTYMCTNKCISICGGGGAWLCRVFLM